MTVAQTIDGQYLALRDYITIAKRMLIKHGGRPNNEDDISMVVEYMIRADKRYKDGIGSRIGFRMANARFAVQNTKKPLPQYRKRTTSLTRPNQNDIALIERLYTKGLSQDDRDDYNHILDMADQHLPTKQLKCFKLRYIEGLETKDICAEMKITRAMVSLHLIASIKRLRELCDEG